MVKYRERGVLPDRLVVVIINRLLTRIGDIGFIAKAHVQKLSNYNSNILK
jgi:hypothetical protein